jgi:hypothetical protein
MGQPVSANFGLLDDLQRTVAQTATGIDEVQRLWAAKANGLREAWPDGAGLNFQELNNAAIAFNTASTEFLAVLGVTVGKANLGYQAAFGQARAAVNSISPIG